MQVLTAGIIGAIQGLTEFLPVSSSGHIVLASVICKLFGGISLDTVGDEEIFFDILIHLATLFAVILYFFKDLKRILSSFIKALISKNYHDVNFKFCIYILTSTFVTGVLGLFIKDFAHALTENPLIVCSLLMVTGCVLFVSEKFKSKDCKMNFKLALIVGFFQGLAILPGLSRSGMTIASAVFSGINRIEAARYSFILSIPIILLASICYPVLELDLTELQRINAEAYIVGFVTSFVIGYICIAYFMKLLKSITLRPFAYYCLVAGFIGVLYFI